MPGRITIPLIITMLVFCGCDGGGKEKPIPVELRISEKTARLYAQESAEYSPEQTATIGIVQGNGEYSIIFPKEIFCNQWGTAKGNEATVPYSEDMLKIRIEGESIRIERVSPAFKEEGGDPLWLEGYFLVADSKGKKKLFTVISVPVHGDLMTDSQWEEFEQRMINDNDYWKN